MREYPVREPCPPKCCYPDMRRSNPTCEASGTTATIWEHQSGGDLAEDGRLNASERPWLRSVIENRPKVLIGRSQNGKRVGSSVGTLDDGGTVTRRTIGRSLPIRISPLNNRVSPIRPVAVTARFKRAAAARSAEIEALPTGSKWDLCRKIRDLVARQIAHQLGNSPPAGF